MIRINVIPVYELSIPHLIAEYREICRVILQTYNMKNAPDKYCLGEGHVKWARKHSLFVIKRYKELCDEMTYRGFTVNYPYVNLLKVYNEKVEEENKNDYFPTADDILLNRARIIEKLKAKPNAYTWGNREEPEYYKRIIFELGDVNV